MTKARYGKRICFMDGLGKVEVRVYDGCKYNGAEVGYRVQYTDVTEFGVFNRVDFRPAEIDGLEEDEHDEYLKIWFADGEAATFRNSHVDMFEI